MDRMFYLSIVYDADGYDRLDIIKKNNLQELDEILSNYKDKKEVLEKYLRDYNINKKEGRLCIVYEDLNLKRKEQEIFNQTGLEYKDQIDKRLTYAHIIPVMYKNERLKNTETCLIELKRQLRDKSIQKRILNDKVIEKNGVDVYLKTNKRYLFETENEQELLYRKKKPELAIEEFLSRIKRAKPDTQYFYFRSLMDICGLGINTKKINNLNINERNIFKTLNNDDLRIILEEDSKNMDDFYIYHDLDEVIRNSPNSDRPIGSEGRKK